MNTSSEDSSASRTNTQSFAKDYVESLHQNSRATLLFGKNNVLVLPAKADVTEPMPGYLSLHQTANCLTIKWTPNQLMNGFTDEVQDKRFVVPCGFEKTMTGISVVVSTGILHFKSAWTR